MSGPVASTRDTCHHMASPNSASAIKSACDSKTFSFDSNLVPQKNVIPPFFTSAIRILSDFLFNDNVI